MAYYENNKDKILKLIRSPKIYCKNIYPFIKSRFVLNLRLTLEFFNIYKLSNPYPGHNKLLKTINFKDGFFVEVGGNDGFFQDPTYFLEKKMNWKGLIVEPLKIKDLNKNRKNSLIINKAIVSKKNLGKKISMTECNAMSFLKGFQEKEHEKEWVEAAEKTQNIRAREIVVETETLDNILESNKIDGKIDLMVIDVEGLEVEVLKSINLDIYTPIYILVECKNNNYLNKIKEIIDGKYRIVEKITDMDYLFKIK